MTPELIAILAAAAALAGLILQGQRSLGARMDRLEAEIKEVRDRLEAVRDRLSRLEGKMDFLESYIVRRDEAGAPAQ